MGLWTMKKRHVLVDYREPEDIKLILRSRFNVEETKLEVGDFVVGDIVVERKTVKDLWNSIVDRRIFAQLRDLSHFKSVLVVEGTPAYWRDLAQVKAVYSIMLVSNLSFRVPVISVLSRREILGLLEALSGLTDKESSERPVRKLKRETMDDVLENILVQIPGIGIKSAQVILRRNKTLCKVFSNPDLSGLSKRARTGLLNVLNYEYKR